MLCKKLIVLFPSLAVSKLHAGSNLLLLSFTRINQDGVGELLACLREWQESSVFRWSRISLLLFLVLLKDLI